jgi:hypothetical protein
VQDTDSVRAFLERLLIAEQMSAAAQAQALNAGTARAQRRLDDDDLHPRPVPPGSRGTQSRGRVGGRPCSEARI